MQDQHKDPKLLGQCDLFTEVFTELGEFKQIMKNQSVSLKWMEAWLEMNQTKNKMTSQNKDFSFFFFKHFYFHWTSFYNLLTFSWE